MPLSQKNVDTIEKRLFPDEISGEQPTAKIEVTRRDLRFLVQAIQYYHDHCCPMEEEGVECAMLVWGEDVHSGAIESICRRTCMQWIDDLLSEEVLSQFEAGTRSGR
ncbi:MAG: hypothetical protein ACYC1C_04500 [Chloroflexota bacterium]